jgi:hypothetical protein
MPITGQRSLLAASIAAAMSEHSCPPIAPPLVVASVQKTMTSEPSIRPRAMTTPSPARSRTTCSEPGSRSWEMRRTGSRWSWAESAVFVS